MNTDKSTWLYQDVMPFAAYFDAFGDRHDDSIKSKPFEFDDTTWDRRGRRRDRRESINIGPHISITNPYTFGRCTPTDEVANFIRERMIAAGVNDSISFEICRYPDGTGLVVAKNSQILGSRWLGLVDLATLPEELRQ